MRVLFHYTHKQSLGHTTRSISFAKALSARAADVLILQGGLPQPFIRFPQACKVLDIPLAFDSRRSFRSHQAPVSSNQRARFILKAASDFKPDVLITEFFPFGRLNYMPELLPTLRYLKKRNTCIMASIGYPILADLDRFENQHFAALNWILFAFFDKFLIHTPPALETRYIQKATRPAALSRTYAAIMKKLREKICYTGYIFPEKVITGGASSPTIKTGNNIVVSRGGGAVYPKLITAAIEAQRYLDNKISTIIACGPSTSSKEMALFQSRLKPKDKERVFLVNHLDNLDDVLRSCRVSVSLCGYNTSVQLMKYGTPSVIVPYQNTLAATPLNDQIARAKLLQEKFSSIVLDSQTLTGKSLAKAIKKQMNRPRPAPAPADWFNGADVAAQTVFQAVRRMNKKTYSSRSNL